MLGHEETIELLRIAKSDDTEGAENAKQRLIEHNTPLIKSIIRRYRNKGAEYDDLLQLGSIGFLKAISGFDESFGVKFSTYAVPMIAGEVKRFLRDDGYIKVSRQVKVLAGKIANFVDDFKKKNFNDPSIAEIAEEFAVEQADIVFAMDACRFPISLYERSDDGDEKSQCVLDKIVLEDKSDDNLDKLILKDLISALPDKEKKLVLLRFFRDKTQSEISKILGVSQVQISRMESKIIKKLKEHFAVQ